MGDEIQAIKAGLLEVADIVVVNKGDRPGAHRTAGQLQAMLSHATSAEASQGLSAPKDPEVLVTTAATGEGVAGLLAAIDRHRSSARDSLGSQARLKRAEAQVWAVLVDRLHERVRSIEAAQDESVGGKGTAPGGRADDVARDGSAGGAAAGELLRAVASHELDPFAAADALLALLTGGADGAGEPVRTSD
jgi:LAO/AO transport system kinase